MKCTKIHFFTGLVFVILLGSSSQVVAQVAPVLGNADVFAVLAGSTVTNTGSSILTGNLGVSPGTVITGFPPGLVVGGSTYAGNAFAALAQTDLTTAYNFAAGQTPTDTVAGDIGGTTLTPGVYNCTSSLLITGDLTLDAEGIASSVWIFQIATTLTTASNSHVVLINNADACNIYWQVGSSATLGTNSVFKGTIMALTSITMNTGAMLDDRGRALARNGAVTLDTNNVTTCGGPLLVTLISFEATQTNKGVQLDWETGTEIEIVGFELFRQSRNADGSWGLMYHLNKSLIPAEGGPFSGARYTFIDPHIKPGATYLYVLKSLELNSQTSELASTEISIRKKLQDNNLLLASGGVTM